LVAAAEDLAVVAEASAASEAAAEDLAAAAPEEAGN